MQQFDFTRTSLLLVAFGYTINASTFSRYVVFDGAKIQGSWSTTHSVDKGYQCCIACDQDAKCTAVNHNIDTKTCELWHESDRTELTISSGWKAYFLNNDGPFFETCTFDAGWCSWSQSTNDEFDWSRHKGSTSSAETGPDFDHTNQTSSGYYAYIEASSPRKLGDAAVLKSVWFPAHRSTCFRFAYHMYGVAMGTLEVILEGASKNIVFTMTGDKGQSWNTKSMNIYSESTYHILVRAERGSNFESDIAIDDLSIDNGLCT